MNEGVKMIMTGAGTLGKIREKNKRGGGRIITTGECFGVCIKRINMEYSDTNVPVVED